MARAPGKSAAPKKRAARSSGTHEGVRIETLLNNASVKVTRTTMQPGAETPPQPRGSDYVIFPVTEYGCVRRYMRNGKVTREVDLPGVPGKPYFARATRPGAEFALVNISDKVIIFDKLVLKRG
jgi:hypothetical protein